MTSPVRLGVLGCADVARRRTLPAVAACARVRLVAVASRDADKARKVAEPFGCDWVGGYDELLCRDDVDAVYVPLPTGLHVPWCLRALLAGKHVLVEKPMASGSDDLRAVTSTARECGLTVMENRMFVEHAQHRTVDDLVRAGRIGEPRMLTSAMTIPPRPDDDIRYRAELGGGALLDVGYYPVHAALRFLRPPVEVIGAHLARSVRRGVDVRGNALLCGADGVTAQLAFGFDHFYRAHYELCGTKGRISVPRAFTPPPDQPTTVLVEQQDTHERMVVDADDQFRDAVDRFAGQVLGASDDMSTMDTTERGIALLERIRETARIDLV